MTPAEGSRELDQAGEVPAQVSDRRNAAAGSEESVRILHVDDEPSLLELSKTSLEGAHDEFTVVTETSASDALDRLESEEIDCIVSDYQMPEMDGMAFLEGVREEDAELPFILFTGRGSEEVASDAMAAGVTDYLQKESGLDQFKVLSNRIHNCVAKVRTEQALDHAEEEFRHLVDAVVDYAIFMLDLDGYITSWNKGAEQIKGYRRDEIVGEHFSKFYTEVAREAGLPARLLEVATEDGSVEDEGWRVRKDGSRFWANVTITALLDGDGNVRGFVKVTRDMTERKLQREALREEKERFQSMVQEVKDYAIFMLDPDGVIQTWNEGAERIKGYREAEAVGEHMSMFYPDEDVQRGRPAQLLGVAESEGRVVDEGWRVRKDGSRFWANVTITTLRDDDGNVRGFAKVTRDLTERKRREDRLAALNEMARDLIAAESTDDVAEVVVEAATNELDLPVTIVALYDEEDGTLRPIARTPRAEQLQDDVPFLDPAGDRAWDVFGGDDPTVIDEIAAEPDAMPGQPLTGGAVFPLGRHGVFIIGFTSSGEVSDTAVEFGRLVASDLEAALNHVERQQLLVEREATLEEQNETLERVNRINGVIRSIDQALVDATTREEIQQVVCDKLAGGGPYRFAWIGQYEPAGKTIAPRTWAGTEANDLQDRTITIDESTTDQEPAATAAATREPFVIETIRSDPPFAPWRKEALKRGYRSAISVPLLYEDSLYGVLTIYADQPKLFAGMERQVIEELGETIGHAINALERKHALVSDDYMELEFRLTDSDIQVLHLVTRTDCAFELQSVVSGKGDTHRVFFTARGVVPEELSAFAAEALGFADLRLIAANEADECLFECTMTGQSLVGTLLDHGAVPRTLTAENGTGRLVVILPHGADVREFTDMLTTKYPGSELQARRTREQPGRTHHEFEAEFDRRLTDRQREVLQTAYFSGFFDSPRKRTGEEIGEALGVSQPTVNHHLRASQRKFLDMLYGDDRPGPSF